MSFFQPVALQPGESLNSLLMRKAELNGYHSAHALLLEAGLSMKTRYSPTELEQLSDCFEIKGSYLADWS